MAAFPEQELGVRLLKIAGADLTTGNMRCDRQHGGHTAMTIIQSVDQVQVAGTATACAYRQLARQLRLGAGRKGSRLFVPVMDPFDLLISSQFIRNAVEGIPYHSVDAAYYPACSRISISCAATVFAIGYIFL